MRFFFRSRKFKLILSVFVIVLAVAIAITVIGAVSSPAGGIVGAISTPFQKIAGSVSDFFSEYSTRLSDGQNLMAENEKLKKQVDELNEKIVDYEKVTAENDELHKYLGLKEEHTDYELAKATLITRDSSTPYASFTIGKGSLSDISVGDPVVVAQEGTITRYIVVGYVSEVSASYSKVTSVINPDIELGGMDNRTSDAGMVTGTTSLAKKGRCKLYNLPRDCSMTIGDYVVTSGGGVFPEGLIIGKVSNIKAEQTSTSVYAEVTPLADLNEISDVMVITAFTGQGESTNQNGGK